jgi:hypothetical protein
MAKCVFTLNDVVYTIGGAKDQKTKETVPDLVASEWNAATNSVVNTNKAPMQMSRASFGATYHATRNEIIVAGGYSQGELTKKVERYSVAEDKWYYLADMNEFKCSNSLCIVDDRWLYSFGGLSKIENTVQLNTTVERLDLNNPNASW